ncbi:copper-translocating P-type ATPase [Phototrophicus methaneseepsis]|uniref:Copper-translocating P-type ATPase n=1 Tax=Phototrophicus methaneseepsis TaxID=2710758 RepID=A0A7S8E5P6_9CHLR|nr:copper-translocating P-type ATPase [Phototrophicus methaneseepsis]QPC80841.1 copper-translocating P-type ATPase [Phototrophicus methaneseepsis]
MEHHKPVSQDTHEQSHHMGDEHTHSHGHAHHNHDAHQGHGGHGVDHSGHEMMFRNRFWVSLVLTIPVLLFSPMIQSWFGFSMPEFTGSNLIGPGFAILIFFYGGMPFLQMAIPEIQNRKPGMMTLISLAITTAFVYSLFAVFASPGSGFFWEMATLIDIMLLGHWMEMRSVRQASGALNELAKLMPDTAERVTEDGQVEQVSLADLSNGDVVLVRPGTSVPADGEIIEGHSDLNESMITGESKPVEKSEGDSVIGGTINGDGSLRVRVSATGDDTALAGIMRLVEEAQGSKSNTQILADKAAGWLFYVAIAVAAITAVLWVIAVGFEVEVLERVVTVLVIACPHALGLAIPLVVAISTSIGARNGILVRNRLALEEARQVNTVIFDKTGTLTEGRFGVANMVTAEGWDENRALSLALAVEGDSEHPIARGIRRKAEEAGVSPASIRDFEAIKGRGIKAIHEGEEVYVGGPRLLEMLELDLSGEMSAFRDQANADAQTVVYMVVDNQVAAAFALADVIREESKEAIQRLHEMNIEVAMLTGDSQHVADAVARQLGIDTVFAEVLPEHKDQKVAELQSQGKKVAMVGDGVNDAPALTRADIGIAIGSGTDVAIESAGIILVQSNPLDVVKIFELSQATYRKMIQNLIWAMGYNVVALPLAAGILAPVGFVLSPAVGAVFMSLSTIIVAINAQLLRRTELSASAA